VSVVIVVYVSAASQCSSTEFRCDDGTCIDAAFRCDRQYHCPDGTDEFHCHGTLSSLILHVVYDVTAAAYRPYHTLRKFILYQTGYTIKAKVVP